MKSARYTTLLIINRLMKAITKLAVPQWFQHIVFNMNQNIGHKMLSLWFFREQMFRNKSQRPWCTIHGLSVTQHNRDSHKNRQLDSQQVNRQGKWLMIRTIYKFTPMESATVDSCQQTTATQNIAPKSYLCWLNKEIHRQIINSIVRNLADESNDWFIHNHSKQKSLPNKSKMAVLTMVTKERFNAFVTARSKLIDTCDSEFLPQSPMSYNNKQ